MATTIEQWFFQADLLDFTPRTRRYQGLPPSYYVLSSEQQLQLGAAELSKGFHAGKYLLAEIDPDVYADGLFGAVFFAKAAGWLPDGIEGVLVCDEGCVPEQFASTKGVWNGSSKLADSTPWFSISTSSSDGSFRVNREVDAKTLQRMRRLEARFREAVAQDDAPKNISTSTPLASRLTLGGIDGGTLGGIPTYAEADEWEVVSRSWNRMQKEELLGADVAALGDLLELWRHLYESTLGHVVFDIAGALMEMPYLDFAALRDNSGAAGAIEALMNGVPLEDIVAWHPHPTSERRLPTSSVLAKLDVSRPRRWHA